MSHCQQSLHIPFSSILGSKRNEKAGLTVADNSTFACCLGHGTLSSPPTAACGASCEDQNLEPASEINHMSAGNNAYNHCYASGFCYHAMFSLQHDVYESICNCVGQCVPPDSAGCHGSYHAVFKTVHTGRRMRLIPSS